MFVSTCPFWQCNPRYLYLTCSSALARSGSVPMEICLVPVRQQSSVLAVYPWRFVWYLFVSTRPFWQCAHGDLFGTCSSAVVRSGSVPIEICLVPVRQQSYVLAVYPWRFVWYLFVSSRTFWQCTHGDFYLRCSPAVVRSGSVSLEICFYNCIVRVRQHSSVLAI